MAEGLHAHTKELIGQGEIEMPIEKPNIPIVSDEIVSDEESDLIERKVRLQSGEEVKIVLMDKDGQITRTGYEAVEMEKKKFLESQKKKNKVDVNTTIFSGDLSALCLAC